jgi:hypothetical protein
MLDVRHDDPSCALASTSLSVVVLTAGAGFGSTASILAWGKGGATKNHSLRNRKDNLQENHSAAAPIRQKQLLRNAQSVISFSGLQILTGDQC